jgi:predicted metal-dependent phosphoesterase TrpH
MKMPNTLVDLHMHSTASDGTFQVDELVKLAVNLGLKTIALTDHDTTAALDKAITLGQELGLEVIPGIELSAEDNGEVHILGYFIKYNNPDFQAKLQYFRDTRLNRGELMAKRLAELGMPVEWERVLEIANGASVGRPHFAEAMKEKGYVQTIAEAFEKYLHNGGPAFVDRQKITPVEAVEMIKSVGGVAVMAHPTWVNDLERILEETVKTGLVGMETFYGHYDDETVERFLGLCRQFNLVPTGGSDFHGRDDGGQVFLGDRHVPVETVGLLKERIPQS